MIDERVIENPQLHLNVLRLKEEGKSEDYIKSYITGWLKKPSENESGKSKRTKRESDD